MPAQSFWFIFQGTQLLVSNSESAPTLPTGKTWRTLSRSALRTHALPPQQHYRGHAMEVDEHFQAPTGYRFTGLRTLFGCIDDKLLSLAGLAFQIIDWDRTHLFCSRCATSMEHHEHERVRICPAARILPPACSAPSLASAKQAKASSKPCIAKFKKKWVLP